MIPNWLKAPVAAESRGNSTFWGPKSPIVNTYQWCQVGIGVTDIAKSTDFYTQIGFSRPKRDTYLPGGPTVLVNRAGLQLHLFLAEKGLVEPEKNILMDFPTQKYPGHTHICFSVSSVFGAMDYLKKNGVGITGERPPQSTGRPLIAIFCRDPDRNTIEFEKTGFSLHDTASSSYYDLLADLAAHRQTMDHVGTRIFSAQASARWAWYADKLGFGSSIMQYPLSPDPLKNISPWVASNAAGCELNYLPNANRIATSAATACELAERDASPSVRRNILVEENGSVLPGLLYVGLLVDNAAEAGRALSAAGVHVFTDEEVKAAASAGGVQAASVSWDAAGEMRTGARLALSAAKVAAMPATDSVFVMDDDAVVWRLVSKSAHKSLLD